MFPLNENWFAYSFFAMKSISIYEIYFYRQIFKYISV